MTRALKRKLARLEREAAQGKSYPLCGGQGEPVVRVVRAGCGGCGG